MEPEISYTKEVAPYEEIPCYDVQRAEWSTVSFYSREELLDFAKSLFKEPGKYALDAGTLIFREQAALFEKNGYYCDAPFRSKDFIKYWDTQKSRCRSGVIVRSDGKTWYLTRQYYMWLNFLPIYDKEQARFRFPDVRDAQYHMALYEWIAELSYKHAAILKKRQIASSYFHAARMINKFWFEEGAILKMGASTKSYINTEKGTWRYLNEYRNFLNEHTAWYRPMDPDKDMAWMQRIKVTINGRDHYKGLRSQMTATSFEKDATAGVGGPCTEFFHEEAGIAPKMDQTFRYMKPAMRSGMVTTGIFIAAGSVGDLDQCEPLKEFIEKPEQNGFLGVETDLIDDRGTLGVTALFIPEQWSMQPFIDGWGNSLVDEALKALEKEFSQLKKDLSPESYQLEVSQRPRTIEEAFAARTVSKFPPHLVSRQERRIEDKVYPLEYFEIGRNAESKPVFKETKKIPISEWPVRKADTDKEGCIVVHERPITGVPWGTYYASVDPVSEGKTTTSESLCSIYIMKNAVEITKADENGNPITYIERERIVAWWCGRFDDINKTHERLELLIEMYNAWTIVENNVSLFIQYMIQKRKQRYLVPKDQILFLKDLGANMNVYQEYGWKNTGQLFKGHLLSYLIEFLKEVLDQEVLEDGTVVSTIYGIERIPDIMAMKEMKGYADGANVDRLVALAALVAFAMIQRSNRGLQKRVEYTKNLETSKDLYKLKVTPFRHFGSNQGSSTVPSTHKITKSPYRNLR
jgi:hypothetical protein